MPITQKQKELLDSLKKLAGKITNGVGELQIMRGQDPNMTDAEVDNLLLDETYIQVDLDEYEHILSELVNAVLESHRKAMT